MHTCKTCLFWKQQLDAKLFGKCIRNPPQVQYVSHTLVSMFPETRDEELCGEYRVAINTKDMKQ